MKKRWTTFISLFLMLALLLCLTACGGKKNDPAPTPTPAPAPAPAPAPTPAPTPNVEAFEPVTATLGDYEITILGAEEFDDIDGEPAIRFYYDFTNYSDESASAWMELTCTAEQDGYELTSTYDDFEDDVPEYGYDGRNIRPGVTIRCISEFSYKPDGGEIVFTIEEWWSEETMQAVMTPDTLTGRPAEDFVIETIADPSWTSELSDGGVYNDDYYLYIDTAEAVEGYDGNTVFRVYFEFTNNSEEPISPWFATNLYVYQDGVQLETALPMEDVPEDDAYSTEVAPGETVLASECFEMISDSPLEVEFVDYDGSIGALFRYE